MFYESKEEFEAAKKQRIGLIRDAAQYIHKYGDPFNPDNHNFMVGGLREFSLTQKIRFALKGFLGTHNVNDASTCWFSRYFLDVHDYQESKGGNGYPIHYYTYECPTCGKKFLI